MLVFSVLLGKRGSRNPDVTVGVHVGREGPSDGSERLAIVSLSVPLPLFKRNNAAIGQAMTDLTQAEVERASALRDSEVRIRQLWSRLSSQRERMQRLQRVLDLPLAGDVERRRGAGKIVENAHSPGDHLPVDEPAGAVEYREGLDAGIERLPVARIHQLLRLVLGVFRDGGCRFGGRGHHPFQHRGGPGRSAWSVRRDRA